MIDEKMKAKRMSFDHTNTSQSQRSERGRAADGNVKAVIKVTLNLMLILCHVYSLLCNLV